MKGAELEVGAPQVPSGLKMAGASSARLHAAASTRPLELASRMKYRRLTVLVYGQHDRNVQLPCTDLLLAQRNADLALSPY